MEELLTSLHPQADNMLDHEKSPELDPQAKAIADLSKKGYQECFQVVIVDIRKSNLIIQGVSHKLLI